MLFPFGNKNFLSQESSIFADFKNMDLFFSMGIKLTIITHNILFVLKNFFNFHLFS